MRSRRQCDQTNGKPRIRVRAASMIGVTASAHTSIAVFRLAFTDHPRLEQPRREPSSRRCSRRWPRCRSQTAAAPCPSNPTSDCGSGSPASRTDTPHQIGSVKNFPSPTAHACRSRSITRHGTAVAAPFLPDRSGSAPTLPPKPACSSSGRRYRASHAPIHTNPSAPVAMNAIRHPKRSVSHGTDQRRDNRANICAGIENARRERPLSLREPLRNRLDRSGEATCFANPQAEARRRKLKDRSRGRVGHCRDDSRTERPARSPCAFRAGRSIFR